MGLNAQLCLFEFELIPKEICLAKYRLISVLDDWGMLEHKHSSLSLVFFLQFDMLLTNCGCGFQKRKLIYGCLLDDHSLSQLSEIIRIIYLN